MASFIWANSLIGLDPAYTALRSGISEGFLDGYQDARALTAREQALLPLFFAAKEMSYLCGISVNVNYIGPLGSRFASYDWFTKSIRGHLRAAQLL